MRDEDVRPDWDDSEDDDDVSTPGPDPERLNIEGFTPEEVARRIMAAGKPESRKAVEGSLAEDEEDE